MTYSRLAAPAPKAAASASVAVKAASAPENAIDFVEKAGQSGDSYGGFSALFTALAFIGVAWAGWVQHQQLIAAQAVHKAERFESQFFQMLGLTRDIAQKVEVKISFPGWAEDLRATSGIATPPEHKSGGQALDHWADRLYGRATTKESKDTSPFSYHQRLKALVKDYVDDTYMKQASELGPYFRALYQTFALIDDAVISIEEKTKYAKIARSQISEGAIFLLAVNGLSRRGQKFIKYIERYGLLEHMLPKFLNTFKPMLLLAYDPLAFLGSQARQFELESRMREADVRLALTPSVFCEDAN